MSKVPLLTVCFTGHSFAYGCEPHKMIFLYILLTSGIILGFAGVTTAEEDRTGFVNDTFTLPCTYSANREAIEVCWRKADCSKSACNNAILRTNSSTVVKSSSVRYKLLGNITKGDASLTITRLMMKDKGTYCCKVILPGPSSNVKRETNVHVYQARVIMGSMNGTATLPCTYTPTEGLAQLCWGKGDCSKFQCLNSILRTNSSMVTRRTSNRYRLLGDLLQGNASLTIASLTTEDDGIYCCKVNIPGPSNDVSKEINLQILSSGERLNWNLLGNVIRGAIIFLVPTMVLLIYKCCPL
ncbi:junctional adhesion molecule-like isoform X2 [Dendropsophus ebraccatus]|uniref:junctional adhesion molecule-like isoform X2 n=1 Tax=Dendropsophus ebraccatus TaxID=150705 RepID=UPI0038317B3A